jgi:large subunit ribosomal protein L22
MAETKKTTTKKTTKKVEEPVVEEVKEEAAPVEEAPKAKKAPAKKAAAPKKAKEEKKVEAPKKPMPTEAKAIAKNVRVTPRKVRLVIDLVRGLPVKEALGILANVNKAASEPVMKVIKSAAANATNNFGMDEDALYIAEIFATDGLRMKRYLPRAKGSASGLVKRSSHITCVVKMR